MIHYKIKRFKPKIFLRIRYRHNQPAVPIYGEGSNSKVEKAELTIEKSIIDSVSNENVSVPKQLLMLQIHKIFL